ncbi:PKD-like domain-containing protein, partial [Bacteroidota bacterium]
MTILSNVAGATFSWTATPSSANIIGWGPGTGTLIDQMLTNTGFASENVTYHITPTANGCTGTVYDFVATVVSQPDVYFNPAAPTICDGENTNVQVLSHVTSATFTWTALGSSPNVSGYADGSGPLIDQTISNSGITVETVTYTATPVAFGCPGGVPDDVVVTVNPTSYITVNPLSQSICSESATNIPLTSTVTGTTFAWTATPSS